MARAQRIYVPNGIYHVMARGNRRQVIFMDARDRGAFVKILAEASERYSVDVQAECRMFTHYHAVVRTPRANVSEFMDYLNGQYAQYSNRRHHLTGHLFGERFKPILVDTGFYLRVLMAYVMNNPVAAVTSLRRPSGHGAAVAPLLVSTQHRHTCVLIGSTTLSRARRGVSRRHCSSVISTRHPSKTPNCYWNRSPSVMLSSRNEFALVSARRYIRRPFHALIAHCIGHRSQRCCLVT